MHALGIIVIAIGAALVACAAIWGGSPRISAWLEKRTARERLAEPTWIADQARTADDDAYPNRHTPDLPTFRVIALGTAGAGKTVLLASQAHRLLPTADRRYHLASGLDQNRVLARIHQQVGNTSAPWPYATRIGDEHEFVFDCNVLDREHRQRTVLRIEYLDYPGDFVEPSDVTPAGELEASVEDAHALLLILDGQRVLQLLDGRPEGRLYFDTQLWPMLALAHRATCPIQLIVTKWDLVRSFDAEADDDDLLRKVSRLVMEFPAIRQMAYLHTERGEEVRLIPVSSLGPRFAELRSDGTVGKRPDGKLDPWNVEVPLCAVIPDLLKRVELSLEPSVRRDLDDEIDRAPGGDVASIAASVLSSRVGMILRHAVEALVGDLLVALFVETIVRSRPGRVQPAPEDHGEAETRWLRVEVITDMERIVRSFEDRLPSSIIWRRR